jgi:hypothetical protein
MSKMYKAGTVAELEELDITESIPEEVYQEAFNIVTMLDQMFGDDRDIDMDDGGFVFIAEDQEDLEYFHQNCVNLESETLEYVELVPSQKGPYLNAFFLYNEYEQGMTLFVPMSIAPESLLQRLSDNEKRNAI